MRFQGLSRARNTSSLRRRGLVGLMMASTGWGSSKGESHSYPKPLLIQLISRLILSDHKIMPCWSRVVISGFAIGLSPWEVEDKWRLFLLMLLRIYFNFTYFACIILLKSISEAHIWLCAAERCELMAALFSDNDLFESNPGVEREFSYRRSLVHPHLMHTNCLTEFKRSFYSLSLSLSLPLSRPIILSLTMQPFYSRY